MPCKSTMVGWAGSPSSTAWSILAHLAFILSYLCLRSFGDRHPHGSGEHIDACSKGYARSEACEEQGVRFLHAMVFFLAKVTRLMAIFPPLSSNICSSFSPMTTRSETVSATGQGRRARERAGVLIQNE